MTIISDFIQSTPCFEVSAGSTAFIISDQHIFSEERDIKDS